MWFKSNVTTPAVTAISFCLIGGTTPAHADLGDQLAKLLADDGAAGDSFGESVAISGTTAIIGAYLDDDNGNQAGSAYLFDISDPKNPVQIAKLLPLDGAEGDQFGEHVAISGATAIVGVAEDDDNGLDSGSAYLFDTITGRQLLKLLPNDGAAGDWFGNSVAISGTIAIVGAYHDDDNGGGSGSAYVFDTSTGQQIGKLLPNDGAEFDQFGQSVAISGTTAIVGSVNDDDNGGFSGSAYLFDITTGRQLFKLLPNDGAAGDRFGISVGISGSIAIVGAQWHGDNGTHSGSAYLFNITTGQQIAELLASDGAAGDWFGRSVSISGTIAIAGAPQDDDNGTDSGSAYLFDVTTGQQLFKLVPRDNAAADHFGGSVAISGSIAIAGARQDDDNGDFSGSAYLFDAADTPPCPADLNEDGTVGASDLLILLAFWGRCTPNCLGDLDGDGNVGASDLLTLLANWGPCP